MISGLVTLAGFVCAGWTTQLFSISETGSLNYRFFWLVPALMSLFNAVWLFLGFEEKSNSFTPLPR